MMDNSEIYKSMYVAVKRNDISTVKEILSISPELLHDYTDYFGSWLHIAARYGAKEMVEYLISIGVDINLKCGGRNSNPLPHAAFKGDEEIVKLLLDKGAILETSDFACNPLFDAIYNGHMNVVKLLVEAGIDLTATYALGELDEVDAYEYARQYGQKEIADYLKEKMENVG